MPTFIKNVIMGVLTMQAENLFYFVAVAIVADLFGLPTIRTIIIPVDSALRIGLLRDAIARAFDIAPVDFNDSLPGCVCQRIMTNIPRRPARFAPAELRHAGAGAVHPSAGGLGKLAQALAGRPQAHGAVGGVHPGFRLRQIPLLPAAHVPLPGTLHLVDLVLGVHLAVVLDVSGVQGFQLFLRPGRGIAQFREHGEKGVAAVPAAQACAGAVAGGRFKILSTFFPSQEGNPPRPP